MVQKVFKFSRKHKSISLQKKYGIFVNAAKVAEEQVLCKIDSQSQNKTTCKQGWKEISHSFLKKRLLNGK